jgi:hypothetical protein
LNDLDDLTDLIENDQEGGGGKKKKIKRKRIFLDDDGDVSRLSVCLD